MDRNKTFFITQVEKIERKFGLSEMNEQLYRLTGIDFTLEVARIATKPHSVPEVDVKKYLLEKFPGLREKLIPSEQKEVPVLLLKFGEKIGDVISSTAGIAAENKSRPNLDFYDNKTDEQFPYQGRYGRYPDK